MTKEFSAVRKEMADESKSIRGEMSDGFKEIRGEIKEIRTDIRSLDARISRIEGYITGRDYNENRKIS